MFLCDMEYFVHYSVYGV